MISELERKEIDYILDRFNFLKVKQTMEALEWTWGLEEEPPEIYELIESARDLLMSCVKSLNDKNIKDCTVSSGGFSVSGYKYPKDTKKYMSLSFQVSERNNFEN